MVKKNSFILVVLVTLLIAYLIDQSICNNDHTISVENNQNEILKIDTIIKKYDSIIYKTKIKTNEKIIVIYSLPDSVLIDSIKSGLQQFDTLGNAKNTFNHGTK